MAVATRHLGWRLTEVGVAGMSYAASAQGIRPFWHRAEPRPELAWPTRSMRITCQRSLVDLIVLLHGEGCPAVSSP